MATAIQTLMIALTEKFGDETGTISIPQDELVKALSTMKPKGRRGKKTRAPKDPDAPKRPTSSYMLWLNDNRKTIASDWFPVNDDGEHCYPDGHDNAGSPLKGRSKVSEITKKAGALWKELTDEDKAPYMAVFAEAQKAYYEAKGVGSPNTVTTPKVSFDNTQRPDAPDGWTGHHESMYLKKVAKDPETGKNIKSIKTFDEAIAKANDLGEGCGGITLTSTGYSLRVSATLHENPEKDRMSGLASWTKDNVPPSDGSDSETEVAPPKKSMKMSVKKTDKVSAKAPEKVSAKAPEKVSAKAPEKVSAKAPEKVSAKAPEKTKKEKKVKINLVPKVVEPEPEPEPESEDDEMEVEQITIDGDDYFLNEKSGDIYHPETQEIVGKSEDGEHTLF